MDMPKDLERLIGTIMGGDAALANEEASSAPYFVAQPFFRTDVSVNPICELLLRSPQIPKREGFFLEAEKSGEVVGLDVMLVEMALAATRNLRLQGIEFWINISPQTAQSREAMATISALVHSDGLGGKLGVEITERQVVLNRSTLDENLWRLKSTGANIILDDFGSGASNFDLACNPVFDAIKVERTMVERAIRSVSASSLVRLLKCGSPETSVRIVAEGIETARMASATVEAGFDELQGFHFSPPLPLSELPHHRLCEASFNLQQPAHRLAGGQ